jgi:hypothetical protein
MSAPDTPAELFPEEKMPVNEWLYLGDVLESVIAKAWVNNEENERACDDCQTSRTECAAFAVLRELTERGYSLPPGTLR